MAHCQPIKSFLAGIGLEEQREGKFHNSQPTTPTQMILLGNLSIQDMETRTGVKFPDELIKFMEPLHQSHASDIQPGKWHCFDAPFVLVCGDMKTATEIHRHLAPLGGKFKQPLQISLAKG